MIPYTIIMAKKLVNNLDKQKHHGKEFKNEKHVPDLKCRQRKGRDKEREDGRKMSNEREKSGIQCL